MNKIILVISGVLINSALIGCISMNSPKVFQDFEVTSVSISDALKQDLQTIPWVAGEFRQYTQQNGHKAFATYRKQGKIKATGFSDEKLTRSLAISEALRLCHAYANVRTGCEIELIEGTQAEVVDLSKYPKEVIGYPDVAHYDYYQKQKGHKALAGNLSGILGGAMAKTELKAQKKAIELCRINAHFSANRCYIITSE
ncbi:hypothetical protein [Marinomonas sp. 2405UD68-3]|uniref:hypothetical protein n=1 Tax=Marinomonas sp. 2405UD68-3 TaxID=3391835 RepID=UPI0039C9215A